MAVEAVIGEPVSPCKFGKCRVILRKCWERAVFIPEKALIFQQVGRTLPNQTSRDAIIL